MPSAATAETLPAELGARALIARVARLYLAPRWPGLLVAALCAVAVGVFTGMLAQIMEPAVNDLLASDKAYGALKPGQLTAIPLTILALAAGRALAQLLQAVLVNRIGHGVVGAVQVELFGRLLHADIARLRASHSGAHLSAVLYDANLIREAATSGVVGYAQHGVTVLAMLVVMTSNDLALTALVAVAAPLAAWTMRRFSRRTGKAARGAMTETSALSSAVMESLDGIKTVKIDGREAQEQARVAEVVRRRQRHIVRGANARAAAAPVTEFLTMAVTAAVLAYAGWRAGAGQMNAGAFTAFMVALAAAGQSLRQLANLQTVMSEGLAGARRLFTALDVAPEVTERPDARALPDGPGEIVFERVGFAYAPLTAGLGASAVQDVSLVARPGEVTALVGPSGGGKTTLLNLIPRFYDPGEGAVLIDGVDVRDATLASLRARIALVGQEPFLFDDTVAANIAYARPDATPAEVEAAARQADAHDFIQALPDGYATVVGEAGARLSGGQRQRIAIARAFLKDAPILLLDEATSALDPESEARVRAALDRLMSGRTVLVIAHRLATVRHAARIYVIDRGQVVESGRHAELVAWGGLYARLAQAQDLETVPAPTSTPARVAAE